MRELFAEIWRFLKEQKKYWLLPIIICLVLIAMLIVFSSGPVVAPFIYSDF